ncbi:class I SAM-dependent RNA methyltransferase [Gellertiella hungarica]|uniref:23S rRNA (Uracil1939-C5)-methyltransferase n=1 Tax=Gellertiella hungarica TaxID=1572859 RepID=A0A7W6J443_9HYPH|nr:class I SAM-dependent RNA methyltransferase [Gellertiella hungarica]MBB4064393.1 23S rRNA (uracil1939-C5)-methyltransferase [Gellertiella hungarica]
MSTETVTIDKLGAEGDGIAYTEAGPVYVPFTVPGDRVAIARVKNRGTVMSVAEASPDRRDAPCRHFGPDGVNGACGGCSLQHMADEPYRAWKRQLVVDALKARGLTPDVGPLVAAHPGERRRVVFAARRTEKALLLGFNQAESHHIVDLAECPVAVPAIAGRLDVLRRIGRALSPNADPFKLTVTETMSGLDIAADGVKKPDERQRRAAIEAVLAERGIARVSLNGEILVEPARPVLDFGGASVAPPPGGFTQATRQAEEVMAAIVLDAIGKAKRVADLFAGSGTFALRLARKARVHAVEGDAAAIAALDQAARTTQGLKPVTVERRDLFRRPLMASELKVFDAIVFDPPRAGAEAQVKEIPKSGVKTIVAVSCNPLTLARDLSILTAAGYRIASVTPIDQFLWTPHVEAVAVLVKG